MTKETAVIQISHGMAEHAGRYDRFADFLSENGYHVLAHDHRGHGNTTAPDSQQGLFARKHGWKKVIEDVDAVNRHARETFPNLPIILFGHSMGAMIGLNYCIEHPQSVSGAAFWNASFDTGFMLKVYSALLTWDRFTKGSDAQSERAYNLTFAAWNKQFKPNRTECDWLSRNEQAVDRYIADPLCNFKSCIGLWRDLLKIIKKGADDKELAKLPASFPVNLLGGGQDPSTKKATAVERLAKRMQSVGMRDVTLTVHPDNRHEALFELNRDRVMADFVLWLEERI